VEVGSYLGASTCFLAEGAKGRAGTVYCVDTWQNTAMSEGVRDTYQEFLDNTSRYRDLVVPLRGTSKDVGEKFLEEIDLLFIDADHSYEAVTQDLLTWLPRLRPKSWLVMHDSGWAEGVQRAIRERVLPLQMSEPDVLPNLYAVRVDWRRRIH
jgi:predicted O-methyltransferase YrrM